MAESGIISLKIKSYFCYETEESHKIYEINRVSVISIVSLGTIKVPVKYGQGILLDCYSGECIYILPVVKPKKTAIDDFIGWIGKESLFDISKLGTGWKVYVNPTVEDLEE